MPGILGTFLNGRYRLDSELGQGGMGTVYGAHDTLLKRDVAVKVLSRAGLGTEGRARLLREAQAVAQLNHPNVVSVYDAGEANLPGSGGTVPFIVMELVKGDSLHNCPPGSLDEILGIACQVCTALEHAHAEGIIHRDLKPENVLVLPDGSAKLVDFGLARTVDSRLTAEGTVLGTVSYIAPEQALGREIDGRADLYTLGVMLYEWTTERLPFTGDDPLALIGQHLHASVVPPREHNPEIPPALDSLIVQLLSKQADDRPASAQEVRQALDALGEAAFPAEASRPRVCLPGFLQEDAGDEGIQLPTFVARERELAWLDGFLAQALAGQGRVALVTGGPGRGKTALLDEFGRRAMDEHPELLVASGTCNAYSGVGDPYLPFREVLGMLTGEVEARWAAGALSREQARRLWNAMPVALEALLVHGPHLAPALLPREALLSRAGTACPNAPWMARLRERVKRGLTGADGLQQSHLFQQVRNLLDALSQVHPLLLILDDLQWVDRASAGLLFHLGRRLEGSRILIIGAYRAEEVAIGLDERPGGERERHPLEKMLAEFKRIYGDVGLDLAEEGRLDGRRFVDALLEMEPSRLGERFRQALTDRAGGHPLFTVELLQAMKERGDLVQDDVGRWVEGTSLNWEALPARVEAVIAERIERLEGELRDILTVACVEGEEFTAEAVAQVRAVEARELVRRLSGELQQQHRLVRAQGLRRLAARRLAVYRFQHHLFQQYLYNHLDEAERAYLHEDVGTVLEALYGDQADEVAVQLARHFLEAGVTGKAAHYLGQAGMLAAECYANEEALTHLSLALEYLPRDAPQRLDLLAARAKVYGLVARWEAQRADLEAVLAEGLDDDRKRAQVALGLAEYGESIGDYALSMQAAQEAIHLAEATGDTVKEAVGYRQWGRAHWRQGDYGAALSRLQTALKRAQQAGHVAVQAETLHDLGLVAHHQGAEANAMAYLERALRLFTELNDPRGQGRTRNSLGLTLRTQGDYDRAQAYHEQSLVTFRQIGDRRGEAMVLNNLGIVSRLRGDKGQARSFYEQALETQHEIGDRWNAGSSLNNIGNLLRDSGDYAAAEAVHAEALRVHQEIGNRHGEDIALENLGNDILHQGDYARARGYFERSLTICREVGDPKGEIFEYCYLGIVARSLGDHDAARSLFDQALSMCRETNYPRGESLGLVAKSLLLHQVGDHSSAMGCAQQALQITQKLGYRSAQAAALLSLGNAQAGLGWLDEAAKAYQDALAIFTELGERHQAMEPVAGLARVSLEQGDLSRAQVCVEEILSYLQAHTLPGGGEPLRVHLTCYQVLSAIRDPGARDVLARAHALLLEQADKIENVEERISFLENVHAHREIMAAYHTDVGPG